MDGELVFDVLGFIILIVMLLGPFAVTFFSDLSKKFFGKKDTVA